MTTTRTAFAVPPSHRSSPLPCRLSARRRLRHPGTMRLRNLASGLSSMTTCSAGSLCRSVKTGDTMPPRTSRSAGGVSSARRSRPVPAASNLTSTLVRATTRTTMNRLPHRPQRNSQLALAKQDLLQPRGPVCERDEPIPEMTLGGRRRKASKSAHTAPTSACMDWHITGR